MRKQRCSICNGKVKNGVCVVCGMHNAAIERVHYERSEKTEVGRYIFTAIVGIVFPLFLAFMVATSMREQHEEKLREEELRQQRMVESFADTNIPYATTLTAGVYIVGIDIPEGVYEAEVLSGFGSLEIWDDINEIYPNYNLVPKDAGAVSGVDEKGVSSISQLIMFEGAELYLYGATELYLASDDAASAEISERIKNPLIESYVFSYTEDEYGYCEYIAGEDFPEGTYDLIVLQGQGRVELSNDDYIFEEYFLNEKGDSQNESSVVKNLVLPEGYYLDLKKYSTDTFTIELRPSERIISEDYEAFYEDYY